MRILGMISYKKKKLKKNRRAKSKKKMIEMKCVMYFRIIDKKVIKQINIFIL